MACPIHRCDEVYKSTTRTGQRLAKEAIEKADAERLAKEAADKAEAERLAKEAAYKAERLAKEVANKVIFPRGRWHAERSTKDKADAQRLAKAAAEKAVSDRFVKYLEDKVAIPPRGRWHAKKLPKVVAEKAEARPYVKESQAIVTARDKHAVMFFSKKVRKHSKTALTAQPSTPTNTNTTATSPATAEPITAQSPLIPPDWSPVIMGHHQSNKLQNKL